MQKLLLFLMIIPMIGLGQMYGGPTGCISGDCKNGKGIVIDGEGNMYIAEFIDGVPSKKVTINYANDNKYEGEWKGSRRNGKGTMIYANGDKYVGEWVDNFLHGKGIYTYADGTIKEGLWEDNKFVE